MRSSSGVDSRRFEGRTVVVTGGASGIGLATAGRFLAEGAQVAVLDVQRPPDGEVRQRARVIDCDVRSESGVEAAIDETLTAFGGIDILVNAAGIEHVAAIDDTDTAAWDRVMETNLRGAFLVLRAALPSLRRSRGCVVNVASQLALVGADRFAAYTASKSGLLGLTRSTALELAADGVRVNAVCPGAVETPLLLRQFEPGRRGPQGELRDLIAMHPIGRLGRPDELAGPILFLCSEDASFMIGSIMVVDGGYTA